MASPNFKTSLEDQIQTILFDYVGKGGVNSDSVNYIVKWDRKIADFDITTDVPMTVIIARTTNQRGRPSGEIGTSRELWDWIVNIYYFDVEQTDFDAGYSRQGDIVNRMRNALENEPRLRGLSVPINPTSPSGAFNEYVYNNDWTTVVFDNSGEEGYWAFVAEMSLLVQTARN